MNQSQELLGGESCTESGGRKLGLRKSVCPEHREHIQDVAASAEQGGLLVQLDRDSHHLACLVGVMCSPRKNSVPSTD